MKRHLLSAADLTRDDAELVLDHRRGDALAGRPADQEAARAARPHRGQPVLRGLHPHPHLVRGGGQAAQRRRHQLLRQGLQRCPRARASRTPRSPSRRWAPTRSSSATAPAAPRTGSRTPAGSAPAWSTPATAPTSTPPRRCSTRSRCGATWRVQAGRPRRPPGRDRRRRAAQPGGPLQRAAAAHPRRRGHAGRAADAAAGRASRAGRSRRRTTSTRCCPRPTR